MCCYEHRGGQWISVKICGGQDDQRTAPGQMPKPPVDEKGESGG